MLAGGKDLRLKPGQELVIAQGKAVQHQEVPQPGDEHHSQGR